MLPRAKPITERKDKRKEKRRDKRRDNKRCVFIAKGHENVLAKHKNTLEFTKDKHITLDGDCIVGVSSDFLLSDIKRLVRNHKMLRMTIKAGTSSESIEFIANKDFSSSREIVLRLSDFNSDRTLGFRSTKSAAMLSDDLRRKLKNPRQKITVDLEPVVKAIIFDFDNTIEDLHSGIRYAHQRLAKKLFDEYGVYEATTLEILDDVDLMFSLKGKHSSPRMYDRHLWFAEYFKRVGIKVSALEIDTFVMFYWRFVLEKARPMPHAAQVLRALQKRFKTAVMTDSDGRKRVKMERAKTSGLLPYIDVFMTSDSIGLNKPNRNFYEKMLTRLGVDASECVMVGDKPQVDLKLAKDMGMKTVWVKYGLWSSKLATGKQACVDHEITDLKQLLDIMNEL